MPIFEALDRIINPDETETRKLNQKINVIDNHTDWLLIAKEIGVEKQIEIRAELLRAIKRIDKELNK